MRNKPYPQVRVQAEHLGGSLVKYHWPCGHTAQEDMKIGPKGTGSVRLRRPLGHDMTAKMVSDWNAAGGVIVPACRKCKRTDT